MAQLDEAHARTVLESLRRIQEQLVRHAQGCAGRAGVTDISGMIFHLSKLVCEQDPVFFSRLFSMFVHKFLGQSVDHHGHQQLILFYSCFVWSFCYLDEETSALTLALLYGNCKTQMLSGKDLRRLFKQLYGLEQRHSSVAKRHANQVASEVCFYARGRAEAMEPQRCECSHAADTCCHECKVPVKVFLKFLAKGQKKRLWPVTMLQAHLRHIFFGEQFWLEMRQRHSLFFQAEQRGCPSHTRAKSECVTAAVASARLVHPSPTPVRRASLPSEDSASSLKSRIDLGQTNSFTVTYRLLQLRSVVMTAESVAEVSPRQVNIDHSPRNLQETLLRGKLPTTQSSRVGFVLSDSPTLQHQKGASLDSPKFKKEKAVLDDYSEVSFTVQTPKKAYKHPAAQGLTITVPSQHSRGPVIFEADIVSTAMVIAVDEAPSSPTDSDTSSRASSAPNTAPSSPIGEDSSGDCTGDCTGDCSGDCSGDC